MSATNRADDRAKVWVCDSENVELLRAAVADRDKSGVKKLGATIVDSGRSPRKCPRCRRRTETTNHGAAICFGEGLVLAGPSWLKTA